MRLLLPFVFVFPLALAFMVGIATSGFASGWLVLLILELFMVCTAYFVLCSGVPDSICKASNDNCYRIDGRKSRRRELIEQNALQKLHIDIFATLILVVLSGNLVLLLIDTFVIPLPIAADALSIFSSELETWRDQIGARNLDREYIAWQGIGQLGNTEVLEQPHFVKASFPTLIGATLAWLLCSIYVVRVSYQMSIRQLSNGIRTRSTQYLNMDIGRLQR